MRPLQHRLRELGAFTGDALGPPGEVGELRLGGLLVALGRHERELVVVGATSSRLERRLRVDDRGSKRVVPREDLRHPNVEPEDLFAELARFALRLEHPRYDLLAGSAGDATVGVEDRPVEGDERAGRALGPDSPRDRSVGDDDRVSDESVDQRFVLRGVAHDVGEARDDAFAVGKPAAPAGDVAREERHDRGAADVPIRQIGEQLEAVREVAHDDVRESRPKEARERRDELRGRLDAVDQEAGDGLVVTLEERLHARADALVAGLHLEEGVHARPLLR